jgi:hypothetical protein
MMHETEVRKVLTMQKQIEDLKKQVTKTLDYAMKHSNGEFNFGSRLIVDGELWEVSRWEPAVGKDRGKAWCLKFGGKVVL